LNDPALRTAVSRAARFVWISRAGRSREGIPAAPAGLHAASLAQTTARVSCYARRHRLHTLALPRSRSIWRASGAPARAARSTQDLHDQGACTTQLTRARNLRWRALAEHAGTRIAWGAPRRNGSALRRPTRVARWWALLEEERRA